MNASVAGVRGAGMRRTVAGVCSVLLSACSGQAHPGLVERSKGTHVMSEPSPQKTVTAPPTPSAVLASLGDEIVQLIREQYHDQQVAEAWAARHAGYAADVTDRASFEAETARRLAELPTSHTRYLAADDPRSAELRAVFDHLFEPVEVASPGAQFVAQGHAWFTARVFPGGPADSAGLRRGDRVVRADGVAFHPGRAFAERAGSRVRLEIQRAVAGPLDTIEIVPRRQVPKQEWLATQKTASRIVSREGHRIAYAWLWSCAGEAHKQLLADFIAGEAERAEAMVIDFRDGWGGCNPDFVTLFSALPPRLDMRMRTQESSYQPSFRGPLVVLINGRTTSGKEIVTHSLKRHGRVTVVGSPSAGAVAAGKPNRLSDGSMLYVAVGTILVDGVALESHPIAPDVPVDDQLEYAGGRDPQLERALDVAARLVTERGPTGGGAP